MSDSRLLLEALPSTPYFDAIRPAYSSLTDTRLEALKALEALNQWAAQSGITNARSKPIRFIAPQAHAMSALDYETSIAETGCIATRDNQHDFFNALQWLTIPRTKAAINAGHVRELEKKSPSRSRVRDTLTLFDENGVIVAASDDSLLKLLRHFDWQTLFITRRADVIAHLRVYLLGHGLLEKALNPYIGMTGKALLLTVEAAQLDNLSHLDTLAAEWFNQPQNLADPRALAPLPLLGLPGWDARNNDPDFYRNTAYFRTGRRAREAREIIDVEALQMVAADHAFAEESPDSTGQGSG